MDWTQSQIEAVARQFCVDLLEVIGGEDLERVVTLNAADGRHCHTHDFCDANDVMLASLVAVGHPDPTELPPDDPAAIGLRQLMNLAWQLADAWRFDPDHTLGL